MLQQQQVLQDRYQLQDCLGQNAGRQTWLAIDLTTQHPVVVKLLTFSDQVQWDQLRLFEREAQTLNHLEHPHIPKYRDFFCLDDRLLWFGLVQDYIPGHSLKQMLEQGKIFEEFEVRQIAQQILQILIYLHGLSPPILHRDIKPSNLLLNDNNDIYLVDFGAVQDRVAKEGATFTVVGTYGYAPLEQLGGRATPASDLYALGATLIHLVTGIAPANLPHENGRLQFAELVNINPGFVRWLWRLTEVNVNRRFTSAREALQALQANEAAIAITTTTQPTNSQIKLQKSPEKLEISMGRYGLLTFATYAQFTCQEFDICWRWVGLTKRKRGRITDIDYVSRGELISSNNKKNYPAVNITVGVNEYLLSAVNPALTDSECDWLIEELQQWLGFQ